MFSVLYFNCVFKNDDRLGGVMAKKKKRLMISPGMKLLMIVLLFPVCITVYVLLFFTWQQLQKLPIFGEDELSYFQQIQSDFDIKIPEQYIEVYIAAEEKYNVPWTLLAAHHRIETRFSTMNTLISPVGAEGHMQFMPCTFVGWKHPTCSGQGQGEISDKDKTNPNVIKKYGGYGVDANGDGIADPFDIEDAVYSAANYLSKYGAASGDLEGAIYNYNHSEKYVKDVLYYFNLYEGYKMELKDAVMAKSEK